MYIYIYMFWYLISWSSRLKFLLVMIQVIFNRWWKQQLQRCQVVRRCCGVCWTWARWQCWYLRGAEWPPTQQSTSTRLHFLREKFRGECYVVVDRPIGLSWFLWSFLLSHFWRRLVEIVVLEVLRGSWWCSQPEIHFHPKSTRDDARLYI